MTRMYKLTINYALITSRVRPTWLQTRTFLSVCMFAVTMSYAWTASSVCPQRVLTKCHEYRRNYYDPQRTTVISSCTVCKTFKHQQYLLQTVYEPLQPCHTSPRRLLTTTAQCSSRIRTDCTTLSPEAWMEPIWAFSVQFDDVLYT